MSKSIAPNELTKDELIEYLSGRKKHTTPVQRRSRRHFEEELCFFEERMARWMGCGENGRVGSNTDFADLFHPEDQETVMMIHHSLVWLRDEYARRLIQSRRRSQSVKRDAAPALAPVAEGASSDALPTTVAKEEPKVEPAESLAGTAPVEDPADFERDANADM